MVGSSRGRRGFNKGKVRVSNFGPALLLVSQAAAAAAGTTTILYTLLSALPHLMDIRGIIGLRLPLHIPSPPCPPSSYNPISNACMSIRNDMNDGGGAGGQFLPFR